MTHRLIACLLGLFCLPAPAAPLEPLPLAKDAYALLAQEDAPSPANGGFTANGAFLVGTSGVVVINPGPGRRHAVRLEQAIARATPLPIVLVIDTHARPEQVLGTGYFQERGVPVLAHADTVRLMKERCRRCLSRLREDAGEAALAGTEIALPASELEDGKVLEAGGRRLLTIAPPHAMIPGDTAILDLESGVLFTGALVSLGHVPSLVDANPDGLLSALDRLATLPAHVVLPDRGAPGSPARILEFRRYITGLRDTVADAYGRGASLAEVEDAAQLPDFAHWRGYREHHGANARTLYLGLEAAEAGR